MELIIFLKKSKEYFDYYQIFYNFKQFKFFLFMKKLLLSCLVFLGMLLNAQITLGTGTTTGRLPVDSYYGYTYSQQIFTKSEINAGSSGDITGIKFYLGSAASLSSTTAWKVYIGHTTKATFDTTTDWIPLSQMTQVFDGNVTNSGGVVTITFSTPFTYNNVDNLVIACDENTASYNGSADRFYTYTGVTNSTIYYINDTTNPDPVAPPTGTQSGSKSIVTLLGLTAVSTPNCISTGFTPANAATNVSSNVLSWTAGAGSPTGYKLYLGTDAAATNMVNGTDLGNVLTYTIGTPLTAGTTYYWKLVPYNANGDATGCSVWSFTTATAPGCATALTPADLATDVALNPTLSWTAPTGPVSSYDVYFGTATNPPMVANVTTTSYTPTGLLASNTAYFWKIVPKNSIGDATGCAEQSFTTGTSVVYCTPSYTYGTTDGDLISNVEIAGTTLANNTGTTAGGASYTYFTGMPNYTATLQAGNTYNVTVSIGTFGSQNVAVWIDYNDNGTFETSERVGYTTASIAANGTATFPITLACNPPLGTHRMRVRDVYGTSGNSINPCNTYGWGETEDYDVTVSAAVACPAPSAGVAASITTTSATLSWNIGCAETAWDVHVTAAGSGAPTGAPSDPNASPNTGYAVSSLTPDTDYEFWVRANCGSGSTSTWAGPYTFSTPPLPPANDDCANAIAVTGLTTTTPYTNTQNASAASNNGGSVSTCSGTGGMNDGVWYTVVGDGTTYTVSVTPTGWDPEIGVYTGSCGSFTCVTSADSGGTGGAETVTFVAAAGVTYYINVGHYSSTDSPEGDFEIGMSTDGVLGTSEIVADAKDVKIYPNPFNDVLNISDIKDIKNVMVMDMSGRIVKTIANPSRALYLGELKSGTYVLKLDYKDGSSKTVKAIKK